MTRQLIICVESDSKAKTDWFYIKDTIDKWFAYGPEIKLTPVYMAGKNNFNRTKVVNEVKKNIKQFSGDSIVIYCIDTDSIDSNADRRREFNDIEAYCIRNNYELIWFNRDIEEVYIGERVSNSDKKKVAKQFRSRKQINTVKESSLSATVETMPKKSNILNILKKYLTIK